MYPKKLSDVDQAVRPRVAIERRIVKRTVEELLKAGYWLSVDDGEQETKSTLDKGILFDALMETDEDYLNVWKGANKWFGYVKFVYGNDGYDVISDYTVNLESHMAAIDQWIETMHDNE